MNDDSRCLMDTEDYDYDTCDNKGHLMLLQLLLLHKNED